MKKVMSGILLTIVATICPLMGVAKDVVFVSDGVPKAEIVISENAASVAQFGAIELQEHIRAITGVKLPIVTEGSRKKGVYPIYVGGGMAATKKVDLDDLPEQGCLVDVDEDRTILIGRDSHRTNKVTVVYGGNPSIPVSARGLPGWQSSFWEKRGSTDAVYTFLEKLCGVKWLDCTEAGTFCPQNKTLAVKETEIVDSPFIRCRDTSVNPEEWDRRRSPKEYELFRQTVWPRAFAETKSPRGFQDRINLMKNIFGLRMRLGGEWIHCNHSFYWCYDRFWDKKSKNFIKYKPEWFSKHLKKEKRGRAVGDTIFSDYDTSRKPAQMCFSNEEFIKQTIEDVRAYFDIGGYTNRYTNQGHPCSAARPRPSWGKDVYALEPMDNGGYCECDKCRSQYRPDRAADRASRADYWFTFVNKVAKEIKKSHPDKQISTLAYGGSREGLPSFPIEDNVVIHFCWDAHRGPNRTPLISKQRELMQKWRDAYPDRPFGVWLYAGFPHESGTWFGYLPPPGFFGSLFNEQMKFIRDINMRECIFHCGLKDDFEFYIASKLMWNPSEDYETLKKNYFGAFGPAEQPMRRFYDIIEERICNTNHYDGYRGHMNRNVAYGKLFTDEVYARLKKAIDEAQAVVEKSGTDWHKERVKNWRSAYWDYLMAARYRKFEWPSPAKGVTIKRTDCYLTKPIDFCGKDVLAGKPVHIEKKGKGVYLHGIKKEKGETQTEIRTMTTDEGFRGFLIGSNPESYIYRCDAKIGKLKCFRVITTDTARSQLFFDLVGWRDGKMVTLIEKVSLLYRFFGKGYVVWDIYFDDAVAPMNLDAIGIRERYWEEKKITHTPRYIRIQALDGAGK